MGLEWGNGAAGLPPSLTQLYDYFHGKKMNEKCSFECFSSFSKRKKTFLCNQQT